MLESIAITVAPAPAVVELKGPCGGAPGGRLHL